MTDPTQRMREILETLATTIHNLSPGDVGSMDRVLRPIDQALAELSEVLDEARANCNAVPDGEPNDVHIEYFNSGYKTAMHKCQEAINALQHPNQKEGTGE